MFKRKYLICLLTLLGLSSFLRNYNAVSKFFFYKSWSDFLNLKLHSTGCQSLKNSPVLNQLNCRLDNSAAATEHRGLRSENNTAILDTGNGSEKQIFPVNKNLQEMVRASFSYENQDKCSVSAIKHFLVVSRHSGRLGNQMFVFASALGIASRIHYQLIIPPTHPISQNFDQKYVSQIVPTNLLTLSESAWKRMVAKNNMAWLCHNLTLQGSLQNYRYFEHIAPTVKRSFAFRSEILQTAKVFVATEIPENTTKVGIHVRRTDFLSKRFVKAGRLVAEMGYITKAMAFFRNKFQAVHYIVCSDDKVWCQKNIHSSDVTFSQFQEPTIDMAILSLCDHVIMTVGTFGWWAGWLSGGTVVYLSDYAKSGSHTEKFRRREIFYPKKWIGISNADT